MFRPAVIHLIALAFASCGTGVGAETSANPANSPNMSERPDPSAAPAIQDGPGPTGRDTAPAPEAPVPPPETLHKKLDDGVVMCADLYRVPKVEAAEPANGAGGKPSKPSKSGARGADAPKSEPTPLLVCFHATRSSRGEYTQIAPRFVERGFDVLAVDLRFGGPGESSNRKTKERTGTMNETWQSALTLLGREPSMQEAYKDFPAILAWARELSPGSRIALVGSSYSASLAMVYAAEHKKEIAAVFAFSPGEWIDGWNTARKVKDLDVPCFVTCGSGSVDDVQARKVIAEMKKPPVTFFPEAEGFDGLHGVGTLHMRFELSQREIWKRLDEQLELLKKPAPDNVKATGAGPKNAPPPPPKPAGG